MRRLIAAMLFFLPMIVAAQAPLKAFRATSDVAMRIWLPAGTVKVEVWDRDSIEVHGKVGRGAHLYAGGSGPSAKVGIDWDDHANTAIPHGDLVVTVPRKARVWVKMTDGDVVAVGTEGELDVITVTGSIAVREARGVVSVETIDANVTLLRVAGEMRLRSGSGQVMLMDVHGPLTATAVGGLVWLEGKQLQDARIETISGRITVAGTLLPRALIELESHSGTIGLSLVPGTVPALALKSRTGTVWNRIGSGNPAFGRITANSFKGDINVPAGGGIEAGKAHTPP